MKRVFLMLVFLVTCTSCLAGAWGPGSFENDDALDWVDQCVQSRRAELVAATFRAVLQGRTVDAPEAAMAVAAAEVVAAAKGKPAKSFPNELRQWLARQVRDEIVALAPLALKALARIKDPETSELGQLSKDDKRWLATISDLEMRLR
jgi:hypothetical protein